MGTSEPPAKRVRFMDSEVAIDFSHASTHHDRVLLVAGQKFHVISSLLSQFSEYFNALFNSNFKEKNEETIELKDITAEDFGHFLKALYPTRLQVTVENLAGLVQLAIQFLCPIVWGLCLQFLKNKEDRNKFSPGELLQWSEGSDSQELKTLIEEDLIEKNIVGRTLTISGVEVIEFRKLALKCNPDKLKELLEEFIFKDPQRETQHSVVHLLYYSEKYDLSKVRKYLDDWFCGTPFGDPGKVHMAFLYLKICRLPEFENLAIDYLRKMYARIDKTQVVVGNFLQIASQYNILQLQKDVEVNLVNDFNNKNGLKYMNLAVKYNLEELKNLIAAYLTRINSSELSEEDQQIILNATPEVKDFFLRNLLKR